MGFRVLQSCIYKFREITRSSRLLIPSIQRSRLLQSTRLFSASIQENEHVKKYGKDGKHLNVTWNDDTVTLFHSVWLRYNCQCPKCKQPHSGQRTVNVAEVSNQISIEKVDIQDGNLRLKWSDSEDHEGLIPVSYLKENDYSDVNLKRKNDAIRLDDSCWPKFVPEMAFSDVISSDQSLLSFLQHMNISGLCLVHGAGSDENNCQKIAKRVWPQVLNTIYGDEFDVISSPTPTNIAYTAQHLDYHTDLLFYESAPGLQLLHAIQFDDCVAGGENVFIDVFQIANEFRETNKTDFDNLSKIPATFQKIHYDREWPNHLVRQEPHIVLNHIGEIVKINWSPHSEGPLAVQQDHVEPYYKSYKAFASKIYNSPHTLKLRLRTGDIIIFNNRRILHSRTEFELNGGKRILKGTYVNIDHFKTRLQSLLHLIGDGSTAKRMGSL